MPQILYPPARAQTLGEVLNTGGQIFRRAFGSALPYGIIVAVCGDLANLRNLSLGLPLQSFNSTDPVWWAWYVAGNILALLFGSAMILRQKALAAGEAGNVMAEMRQGAVLLSRLIACMALSTLAVSLALVPFILALPMTGLNLTNPASPINPANLNLGMLLLLIPLSLPAAWLSLGLFFAPPALIVKKLGPIEAMRVSFRLLRGNWWRTSVLSAVLVGVLLLAALVPIIILALFGVTDVARASTLLVPLELVSDAIVLPWCSALVLAMMGDLMVRQEQK